MSNSIQPFDSNMNLKKKSLRRRFRKAKSEILIAFFNKYRKCVKELKKILCDDETVRVDRERRRSHAKLQPLPDRPIRRVVTAKLHRNPSTELERLRRKGENWTANDLFRFQYGDPEEGEPEDRRALCDEWLTRLHAISKKYCYLAWYASAIYACYYRLAPLLPDMEEKKKKWKEVTCEYSELFMMGRRIWRRPTHPSRLHVFYDFAMLCVRFGDLQEDSTINLFRSELANSVTLDLKSMDEIEFANSIDKVVRLENHVIGLYYIRRRSTCSSRSSFRSRRSTMTMDHSPARSIITADNLPNRAIVTADHSPIRRAEADEDVTPGCSTRKNSLSLLLPPIIMSGSGLSSPISQSSIAEESDEVNALKEKEKDKVKNAGLLTRKAASALAKLSIRHASLEEYSLPASPPHNYVIPKIIVEAAPSSVPSSRENSASNIRSISPRSSVRFKEKIKN